MTLEPAQALDLGTLVSPTAHGIASRVLARSAGGSVTLLAFDAGQALEEHTSPFEALVLVLEGALSLTISGQGVRATPGTVVRMPGGVPHALEAAQPSRMLLVMLRDAGGARANRISNARAAPRATRSLGTTMA